MQQGVATAEEDWSTSGDAENIGQYNRHCHCLRTTLITPYLHPQLNI